MVFPCRQVVFSMVLHSITTSDIALVLRVLRVLLLLLLLGFQKGR